MSSEDVFDVQLSEEAKNALAPRIARKLSEVMDADSDDETLIQYILLLVSNKRTRSKIQADLEVFLSDGAESFTNWLWNTLSAYQKPRSGSFSSEAETKSFSGNSSQTFQAPPKVDAYSSEEDVILTKFSDVRTSPPPTSLTTSKKAASLSTSQSSIPEEGLRTAKRRKLANGSDSSNSQVNQAPVKEKPVFELRTTKSIEKNLLKEKEREKVKEISSKFMRSSSRSSEDSTTSRDNQDGDDFGKPKALFTSKAKARMAAATSAPISGYWASAPNGASLGIPFTPGVAAAASGYTEMQAPTMRVRCRFWPACENGSACPFFHPTEMCRFWPKCSYGNKCLYIHPHHSTSGIPCRYGINCLRSDCVYYHPPGRANPLAALKGAQLGSPSSANSPSPAVNGEGSAKDKIVCKFDPICNRILCEYQHPQRDQKNAAIANAEEESLTTDPAALVKSAIQASEGESGSSPQTSEQ